MEYNLNDESINSSEEVSKGEEQNNDVDLGVGRSYECVYCKRGFNTAQALGGHMNIHRKDRVKKKAADTSNNSKRQEEEINYTRPRSYQQLPTSTDLNYQSDKYVPDHDHQSLYATYFSGCDSISTQATLDGDHLRPLNLLIRDDWNVGLSLEFSTKEDIEMNHKEELDLELRLGYC